MNITRSCQSLNSNDYRLQCYKETTAETIMQIGKSRDFYSTFAAVCKQIVFRAKTGRMQSFFSLRAECVQNK